MSNFLSKFNRKTRSDYEKLYEIELSNRKKYESRYKKLIEENVELQKETGLANLRVKYNKALDEIAFLKEDRAKLYIQLEDARNELDMLKLKSKAKKGKKENGKRKEILHK